jgi:hypothetical protein
MPRGINAYDEGRLQGRNVANANSSNIISPGIVTEGLVLHLDAGNYQSYPLAGTTWYDLLENRNNATLTNGPTYTRDSGGAIVFDGVDDYAEFSGLQGNFTVGSLECWVKPTVPGTFFQIVSRTNNSILGNFNITKESSDTYRFVLRVAGTQYNIFTSISTTPTAWAHLVATYNGTTQRFYFNSVLQLTENSVSGVVDTSVPYVQNIGRNTNGSSPANAQISVVKLYNRALSNSEIQQNFNATRARFGV